MQALALRIGIIAILAAGAWILRPFITGNAGDLAVGDCFDVPATEQQTVEDVQHHPCTDAHGAEVVFVGDYQPTGGNHPSPSDVEAFVGSTCIPAFTQYTGLDFQTATDYDLGWFWPTAEGWGQGDHEVICYLVRVDEASLTQSLKGAQ